MSDSYFQRLRAVLALLLMLIVVAGAALAVLPSPTFGLWMGHFVAVELGRAVGACGLAAALLFRGGRVRWISLAAALTVVLPGERTRWALGDLPQPPAGPAALSAADTTPPSAPPVVTKDAPLAGDVTADLYAPTGAGPWPLVVVVHGGSWHGGDKGEVPHVSMALARAGALVADVRYRLAPGAPHPAGLADVKCALGTLRARPDVDPARVFLLGRSAGGHLALMAALTAGLPELPPSCPVPDLPVRGVAAMYPTTDLVFGDAHPPWPDPIDNRGAYRDYLGFAPADDPERAAAASPVKYAARATGLQVLLIHGTGDRLVPVEHTERMASALRAAGHAPQVLLVPGADHAFDHHPGGPVDTFATAHLTAFVLGR